MIKDIAKGLVFVIGSMVGVPYTVAVVVNILYGWPRTEDRFKRALSPKKVYKLNLAVLKHLTNIQYAGLFFQWKYFYWTESSSRLVKDVAFGTNGNCMDLYIPNEKHGSEDRPLVVFVYGGTWGSGDKNMYGLLCSNIAKRLDAIVCCPNYSIYPKGYVDDMVQDTVDCIEWLQKNIHLYGGKKDSILLVGHSAGAHLCVMALLELLTKQMLQGPNLPASSIVESMRFVDQHFDGSANGESGDSSGSGEKRDRFAESTNSVSSFVVLDSSGNKNDMEGIKEAEEAEPRPREGPSSLGSSMGAGSESFLVVSTSEAPAEPLESSSASVDVFQAMEESGGGDGVHQRLTRREEQGQGDGAGSRERSSTGTSEESVTAIKPSAEEERRMKSRRLQFSGMKLSKSQQEIFDLLSGIRGVVGMAGVYHIADHYEFETWRGVEHVSTMGRAMYGPDMFDRFSPSVLAESLPENAGLPPIVLLHGLPDSTVPYEQSTKLAQALSDASSDVTVRLIPDCSHQDICLDLMDSKRRFHKPVMDIIAETGKRVF